MAVVIAVLAVAGVAAGVRLAGEDEPAQKWSDFDAPPWTAGIEVGRTYEYNVGAHCGVRSAKIDGTIWRAESPIADGQDVPNWGTNIGQLRIETPNKAVFTNGRYTVVFLRDDLPPGPPCA